MTDCTETDQADELYEERSRLSADLATYRNELLNGFAYPARKHRCNEICRRIVEINLQLEEFDE